MSGINGFFATVILVNVYWQGLNFCSGWQDKQPSEKLMRRMIQATKYIFILPLFFASISPRYSNRNGGELVAGRLFSK